MSYALLDNNDGGVCKCGGGLKLLTHKHMPDGYPAFLICFSCAELTQVDGDNGVVVQFKGGKRKKFLRPLTKKEDRRNR